MADAPNVYVIADDVQHARDWAHTHKPGSLMKYGHPQQDNAARGLYLKDEKVYVLSDYTTTEVREAWQATGAHLVYAR